MWRAACGPRSALPPYFSASGLLSKPPHGDPGERLSPSRHACLSVPSSTSNHFKACRLALSPRHVDEQSWMVGDGGCLCMCGIFSWISGCVLAIVNRPMELRWPNSGTAQHSSGNRGGYDDAKLRFGGLTSLTVGDRAICPRPLLSATQSVPRACIVDLKLASASASAYRRSRGVEHVFDLTGWREPPLTGVEPTHQPRLIVESVEPDLAPDVISAYRRCTSNSIHVCQ